MPQFVVTAIDSAGGLHVHHFTAATPQQARELCSELGLEAIKIKSPLLQISIQSSSKFKLIPFAQELLALQKAGLSITESLRGLHSKANPSQKPVLQGLLQAIHEGQSLSNALAGYPKEFPNLMRTLVRAAEKTSNLPQALEKYLEYAQQAELIKRKISNAALYPSLLLVVGGGVLVFLLMYVVPRFAGVYEGLQGDLPWLSKVLLWWGLTMRDHAAWVLLGLAGLTGFIFVTTRSANNQRRVGQLLLRNAHLANLWKSYRLSRLYRALGLLLTGGIPVNAALVQVEELLGPDEMQQLRHARQKISEGESLSSALFSCNLTTEIAFQMLAVGERTGSVGDMLTKAAQFLESDTSKAVEVFSRIFEPALMALIGIIIGTVVVLMYMPIFELANSLQS
ncbi:type II secretion system F family protein [Limnobacter humi]|uniref:Type II secretion system F family protein n=1 Tax=Limnobacter humi TaxID=1778671 RepID=A0ABT1WE12_9BURK|nr:type II secretion system F family protein [Limnobacter humi]MCQ8895619.1 type II secretion system F family protein [Limnobacter humi]